MTQSTQCNQNKDCKKCSQAFRTFYFFRLNASTDQSGSCERQNLNPSAKIPKSARELSAIHWAFTGDCGRLNYTAQTPLLWFFCNLLCCINFWFAVLVEYIQNPQEIELTVLVILLPCVQFVLNFHTMHASKANSWHYIMRKHFVCVAHDARVAFGWKPRFRLIGT